MTSFIKNIDILEEAYKVDDLLDFNPEIERIDRIIKRIPNSSLIGYIGRFGSGKSTAIYQLQKKHISDKSNIKWLEFDAWKYPERKELWEGFVLDIADQLGDKKKVQKKISGRSKTAENLGASANIALAVSAAAGSSFYVGLPALFVSKFTHIFSGRPAERVFEIQAILNNLLSSCKEESIFIAIEDIDRSGDAGKYFLETLRQFIKNNLPKKRIIVFVPIGTEAYEKNNDHRDSYHKVLDYIEFFEPKRLNYSKFLDAVFDPNSFPEATEVETNIKRKTVWKEHLLDWSQLAASQKLTIREIKNVLRAANLRYGDLVEQGYKPDPRIVLALTLLHYIFTDTGSRWSTRIDLYNPIRINCPVSPFLQAVTHNCTLAEFNKGSWVKAEIRWINNNDFSFPTFVTERIGETGHFILSDFYLN